MAVRRDVPLWLIGDSPSGAEASSGPPDTCRSTGRGVEEATGIPPVGTPGNLGCPHSYVINALTFSSRWLARYGRQQTREYDTRGTARNGGKRATVAILLVGYWAQM